MTAGGTGAYDRKIGAPQAVTNGNIAAGGVGHKARDAERGNAAWAFLQKPFMLLFDFLYAAYASANDCSDTE
ncbi:unnamed protein product [marine sediment metagenome]|uniref:Uncharacterized protein n=1 Tax=marine sediment metagenome TaxID=412755 RepID=X1D962_9ZZZZ